MPNNDRDDAERIISGFMICGCSRVEAEQILVLYGIEGGFSRLDQKVIQTLQQRFGLSEVDAQQHFDSKGLIRVLEDLQAQPQQSNAYSQQSQQTDSGFENYNSNYEDTNEIDNSTPSNEKGEWKDVANQVGYGLGKARKSVSGADSFDKLFLPLLIIGAILLIGFIVFVFQQSSNDQPTNSAKNSFQPNAVTNKDNIPVRSSPDANGGIIETLAFNTLIFIPNPETFTKKGFYEVKTQSGKSGWIHGNGFSLNPNEVAGNSMNSANVMNTDSSMANSNMPLNLEQNSSSEIATATPPSTQTQPLSMPNLDEQRFAEAKNQVEGWVSDRFSGSGQGTRCADSNISAGTSAYIMEADGLSIQVSKDMNPVTPAEEKNDGTEWRGNANISARSHRFYLRFSGSNTWEKTDWINYLAIKVSVKKQNGRWIVTSSDSLIAESKIMAFPKEFKPFDCNKLPAL